MLRLLLLPLAPFHALLVRLRPAMYRWGWWRTHRLGTPVIAVGNLTLGGSGKSPMVEYLLREADRAGLKGAAVSRGYGRQGGGFGRGDGLMRVRLDDGGLALAHEMGDEPCMLARRNPALPVYVGKDRAAAGRLAEIVDAPDVIVLDDAYQHLRLARDLNVLLIDAEQGLGNGYVLPLGDLREPPAAAGRADVVLITKAGPGAGDSPRGTADSLRGAGDSLRGTADSPRDTVAALRRSVQAHLPGNNGGGGHQAPVFLCQYNPQRLVRLDGEASAPLSALQGQEASLICAIAQPDGFRASVEGLGARVSEVHSFRDHHPYSGGDVARLDARLAGSRSEPAAEPKTEPPRWLTTSKDAVKLQGRLEHADRLWVLEMEVVPEPAAQAFFFDFLSALKLR